MEDPIKTIRISDELEEAIASYAKCLLLTRVDACKIEAVVRQLADRSDGRFAAAEIVATAGIEVQRQNLVVRERHLSGHSMVRFFKYVDAAVMESTTLRTGEWFLAKKGRRSANLRQAVNELMAAYRELVM